LSIETISDIEHFEEIEEFDINTFKISIKLLETAQRDINEKMNTVENSLK